MHDNFFPSLSIYDFFCLQYLQLCIVSKKRWVTRPKTLKNVTKIASANHIVILLLLLMMLLLLLMIVVFIVVDDVVCNVVDVV